MDLERVVYGQPTGINAIMSRGLVGREPQVASSPVMIMQLKELLSALPWRVEADVADVQVKGLAFDSRQVKPGDLFVAFKGLEFDGHDYIPQAIEAGAVAAVIDDDQYLRSPLGELWPLPCILVPNAREALAHLASAFHRFPSRKLRVIGVTGTDGKTTTVNLIWSVLKVAGHTAGFISSVN
ncbi:MAG: Mur ligase domain-containing protein, partial [Anaerolineae bacterium]